MNATDLRELNGKLVLVCSAQDHRNPPTGRRGTLNVRAMDGKQELWVTIEFPEMFTTHVHTRSVRLSDEQVAEVLNSNHYGTFTVTLPDRLDPLAPSGNE
jgi:hypothetical protein